MTDLTAQDVIKSLNLKPHPEGGWFRENWRAPARTDERSRGTSIYFLLEEHQRSHWHRVDSTEIWHWYTGHPMELYIHEQGATRVATLGPDISNNQQPQLIVPPMAWQSSVPLAGWVLVGCTVSPGFEFSGFELAPENWSPPA